ncbi:F-box/WD repeat-containing protein 15-like [Mus pahari]|uniref:F-box/WD repeat-containing protein 15-like n=1 Tax=Mus pahari TaxID=10093 RepID=UPI000A30586D|nr:F-box/WD repeat-containing protein 15-like [Mus pahari]
MEIHLPSLPLMKIFSYLDAYSLLQVAQVKKNWNELASSDVLWRKLCQKRWLLSDMVTLQLLGKETWKQFFVCRTWQEHAKTRAKPEDFTYKEILAETGIWAYACYISERGLARNGQGRSVICMFTSMTKISTWDIHEGVMTWVSPEQPATIKLLTTLPEMHMAVTVDIHSTIKLWDCHNGEVLAANSLFFPCQSLKSLFTKDGAIVLAGDTLGNLYPLMWSAHVPGCRNLLFIVSPGQYSLQVFYMDSLLRTTEFSAPGSTILKFSLCDKAFWTPRREDRITLMSVCGPHKVTKFVTFDMELEEIGNQIIVKGYLTASFSLAEYEGRPECFGVSDKDVIVCSSGSSVLLFSMGGVRLQKFQYFPEEVLRLWVDPLHVIVTFINGSLDVYAWDERSPQLRKCYRLQNRRQLPRQSCFEKTLCDDVSIIRMMRDGPNPCYLMAYTLNISALEI